MESTVSEVTKQVGQIKKTNVLTEKKGITRAFHCIKVIFLRGISAASTILREFLNMHSDNSFLNLGRMHSTVHSYKLKMYAVLFTD